MGSEKRNSNQAPKDHLLYTSPCLIDSLDSYSEWPMYAGAAFGLLSPPDDVGIRSELKLYMHLGTQVLIS